MDIGETENLKENQTEEDDETIKDYRPWYIRCIPALLKNNVLLPNLKKVGQNGITAMFMTQNEIQQEIDEAAEKYKEKKEDKKGKKYDDNWPVTAFVIFKGYNDRKRVQAAFKESQTWANVHWWLE